MTPINRLAGGCLQPLGHLSARRRTVSTPRPGISHPGALDKSGVPDADIRGDGPVTPCGRLPVGIVAATLVAALLAAAAGALPWRDAILDGVEIGCAVALLVRALRPGHRLAWALLGVSLMARGAPATSSTRSTRTCRSRFADLGWLAFSPPAAAAVVLLTASRARGIGSACLAGRRDRRPCDRGGGRGDRARPRGGDLLRALARDRREPRLPSGGRLPAGARRRGPRGRRLVGPALPPPRHRPRPDRRRRRHLPRPLRSRGLAGPERARRALARGDHRHRGGRLGGGPRRRHGGRAGPAPDRGPGRRRRRGSRHHHRGPGPRPARVAGARDGHPPARDRALRAHVRGEGARARRATPAGGHRPADGPRQPPRLPRAPGRRGRRARGATAASWPWPCSTSTTSRRSTTSTATRSATACCARRAAPACAGAATGDVVARLGGEEFAWLMPETDGWSAWQAAERARAACAGAPFAGVGRVTVSAGVCDLARRAAARRALPPGRRRPLLGEGATGATSRFLYSARCRRGRCSAEERRAARARRRPLTEHPRPGARGGRARTPPPGATPSASPPSPRALADGRSAGRDARRRCCTRPPWCTTSARSASPTHLLFKPGALTAEEYEHGQGTPPSAPRSLADVLSPSRSPGSAATTSAWTASGYPDGLAGERSPRAPASSRSPTLGT